jgi:surfeit locus 1 family protein
MSKGPSEPETASWVPTGLKVRSAAPVVPKSQVTLDALSLDPVFNKETGAPKRRASDFDEAPNRQVQEAAVLMSSAGNDAGHETGNDAGHETGKPGFRPMPILTILALICLGVLISLGQWQWDKYTAKSKTPTAVEAVAPSSVAAALEAPNPEYRPVIVDGFADPRTIKISVVQNGIRGYRLISPVVLEAGGIFVDRGFVGEDELARVIAPTGQVRLMGVLRKGARPNRYTPDNDPGADTWYWPELTAMADMLVMQTTSAQFYVALSIVDPLATGTATPNPYADSQGTSQIEPGTHLGYALQWWGFGLALIGVYIGLHVRTGRLSFRRAIPS